MGLMVGHLSPTLAFRVWPFCLVHLIYGGDVHLTGLAHTRACSCVQAVNPECGQSLISPVLFSAAVYFRQPGLLSRLVVCLGVQAAQLQVCPT